MITIIDRILEQTKEVFFKEYDEAIAWPGNWPSDAEYGIVTKFEDTDFSNMKTESMTFFNSKEELDAHLKKSESWYKSTSFKVIVDIWSWDFGPYKQMTVSLC